MTGKLSGNIKYLVLSLLAVLVYFSPIFSQTHISGTINKYGRVTGISTDYVVVGNSSEFSQFQAGDTVLLMQMKGVRIYSKEDASYGSSGFSYGKAGMHEFLTVLSVEAGNIIRFRNNIVNTLDLTGDIQIVKVPSYNFAQVDPAGLTSAAWDSTSKTGGVLAAIIGRTLTLNGNIDVTGKGFKGGTITNGLGICANTDLLKWNKFAYSATTDSSGFKGEGLAINADPSASNIPPFYPIYPLYAKGYGRNFNGGGGGNGKFSGGGGGSNYGKGGLGGREIATCSPQSNGGLGGIQITGTGLDGGLFLGGGGGGSTNQAGLPTAGGNGGGIIILICDTLKGNGYKVIAEGATPSVTASGNAGAGGGGGGGSIAIYLQSYTAVPASSALTISASGGKGGNNAGTFGEGGGGGGGFVNTTSILMPGNVIKSVAGGLPGTKSPPGPSTAIVGDPGKNVTTFVPVLNGFLFNSIRSSVTGDQVDSICSNVIPKPITGTTPVGGTLPYSFTWEKSLDLLVWNPISGATGKDYTPTATEPVTFWVRRIVSDASSLIDISKFVKIIVQPAITGNLVGKDTTICYNQNPLNLIPLNSGPSNGNGRYAYQWIQNLDNLNWSSSPNATGTSNLSAFDPPVLSSTTFYQRKITSGRCIDYSATVTITVLPSITGNVTTRPDSVICEGSLFNTLGASAAGGGSGAYLYQWQDSTTSGLWLAAAGTNSNTTYNADTSKFAVTEKRFFRRTVYSGPYNTCQNKSIPILLTRYHKIKNNLIAADNIICSGSVPAGLTGSDPAQGDLTYAYQWQDSTKGIPWATKGTPKSPFLPPALTDTTWYRRIVTSSKCTNTSNIIVIKVHQPVLNNIASLISGPGPDTTICNGSVPNRIKGSTPAGGTDTPGDYAFLWQYSVDNSAYTDIAPATLSSYNPSALTATTWFRRRVISGMCSSVSNSMRVIVLPSITNNVISVTKPAVCYNTVPGPVSGTVLTGGAGGTPTWIWEQSTNGTTWAGAAGTANQQNYAPPALTGKTWYRRVLISGPSDCCIDTSNVITLDIVPLPTGSFTSVTDTTICNGSQVLLKVHLTGASPWKVTYNENTTGVVVNGIGSADYVISRIPSAASSLSVFNYSLAAVEDQNACLATSLTGIRKANVYRVPVANAGPDDAACGPGYTLKAVPSDGTGLWQFPPEVLSSVANDPHSIIKIDSSFTGANVTYTFSWEETNGICKNKDDVSIRFDKRIGSVTAGTGGTIMSFDNMTKVDATPLQPFETGLWSVVTGSGDFDDDAANSTYIKNISLGINTYKWTVTNGKCKVESLVSYEVLIPVIPEGISPDGDLINDSLKISGLDLVNQEIDLTILNGAGSLVFSATNRNGNPWQVWDGKSAKGTELPEGTYYYLLKVYSIRTEHVSQKSGFVILKRN